MDIWDGLRIVMKRWKVAVPIFLAFALLAIVGSGMIDAEYSADGSIILLGPNSQDGGGDALAPAEGATDVNPLLVGCNTCETVARAIQLSLSSTETKAAIKADGLSTKYTIVVENRSPLMTITASSGSPTNAIDTLNGVINRISQDLETRQSDINAPTDQRITASVLSQDTAAKGDYGGRTKARAAILAAGALAAVGVSLLLEGVKLVKRRRTEDDEYGYSEDDDYGSHSPRHGPRADTGADTPWSTPYGSPDVNGRAGDPSRPHV